MIKWAFLFNPTASFGASVRTHTCQRCLAASLVFSSPSVLAPSWPIPPFRRVFRDVRTDEQGDLVGLTRSRCEPGSRWVGYTFQKRDEGKAVKVPDPWGVVVKEWP